MSVQFPTRSAYMLHPPKFGMDRRNFAKTLLAFTVAGVANRGGFISPNKTQAQVAPTGKIPTGFYPKPSKKKNANLSSEGWEESAKIKIPINLGYSDPTAQFNFELTQKRANFIEKLISQKKNGSRPENTTFKLLDVLPLFGLDPFSTGEPGLVVTPVTLMNVNQVLTKFGISENDTITIDTNLSAEDRAKRAFADLGAPGPNDRLSIDDLSKYKKYILHLFEEAFQQNTALSLFNQAKLPDTRRGREDLYTKVLYTLAQQDTNISSSTYTIENAIDGSIFADLLYSKNGGNAVLLTDEQGRLDRGKILSLLEVLHLEAFGKRPQDLIGINAVYFQQFLNVFNIMTGQNLVPNQNQAPPAVGVTTPARIFTPVAPLNSLQRKLQVADAAGIPQKAALQADLALDAVINTAGSFFSLPLRDDPAPNAFNRFALAAARSATNPNTLEKDQYGATQQRFAQESSVARDAYTVNDQNPAASAQAIKDGATAYLKQLFFTNRNVVQG